MRNKLQLKHPFIGTHILGEFYGVSFEKLNNIDFLEAVVSESITKSGVVCNGIVVKKFVPNGVTLLALLSESHISLHTYPEYDALFMDVFTCGSKCDPKAIIDVFKKYFNPTKESVKEILRGDILLEATHK